MKGGSRRQQRYLKPLGEGGGKPYGAGGPASCETLTLTAKLTKTNAATLAVVKPTHKLPVEFDVKRNIAVSNLASDPIGYLNAADHTKIAPCMNAGYKYQAQLIDPKGTVKITHKP